MAAYSGLSGACCPRPGGLLGSYRGGPPSGTLTHWPDQFGYLPKSTICAGAPVAHNAAMTAIAPTDLAYRMKSSLCRLARSRRCPALVWLRNYHTAPFAALEAPASHRKAVEALLIFVHRDADGRSALRSGGPAITPFRTSTTAFVGGQSCKPQAFPAC